MGADDGLVRHDPDAFGKVFESLTGYAPFHWQRQLWRRLVETSADNWPTVVDVPTGLGKTHVITVWWCAFLAGGGELVRSRVGWFMSSTGGR